MKTIGTHNYYTYILTNKSKTVLYIGVTNDLKLRLQFHKKPSSINNFTSKYKCFYLIYYEHFHDINLAIGREKELKGWRREKKELLINSINPHWDFLNDSV